MPASRRPKPRKTKPGPVAYAPTSAERDRVEVAIAMGMTIDEISDEMEMPRSSFCRPAEVEDKWEKIAREIVDSVDGDTNLGRFQDFQKVN
jgi:hypothetical protein